jgi:hypothetical protein
MYDDAFDKWIEDIASMREGGFTFYLWLFILFGLI